MLLGQELGLWDLDRWVRDRRYCLTSYFFLKNPSLCPASLERARQMPRPGYFWSLNKMQGTIITETFLLKCSLKMNLFFHLNLSPQPSFSKIIVCLYKPNFWPFQFFISLTDGCPHHAWIWPPWILQCQPTALFLDPLKLLFRCQVSHLKICLTSQRIWYEHSALDNGQSSSTIMKSSSSLHCGVEPGNSMALAALLL